MTDSMVPGPNGGSSAETAAGNGTVVVTGVTSFVGCHLARHFASRGHRVVGTLARPPDAGPGIRRARLACLPDGVDIVRLDLRDTAAVTDLIQARRPRVWVHHAGHAENHAAQNFDGDAAHAVNVAPLETLYRRLADRAAGLIMTGSSMEYATGADIDREDDPCRPNTPYGASKLAATMAARDLSARWGVPTRVARLYIPVGALDNPAKLLPQAVAALRADEAIDLSPCTQRRDFIGVADVCRGFASLADDLARGGFDIVNLSSGVATPLKGLLVDIANRLGADPGLLRFGARAMRPDEGAVSVGSNDKARRLLDWAPRPLADALERMLAAALGGALASNGESM